MKRNVFILVSTLLITNHAWSEERYCTNPTALDLTERGGLTIAPCTVPYKEVMVSGGYQYFNLTPSGVLSSFPQPQIVFGLPWHTEFFINTSSYNIERGPSVSGFSSVSLGGKAELISHKDWSISTQGSVGFTSGNHVFGNAGNGYILNGIGSYAFSEQLTISGMVGGSSIVTSHDTGSKRFNSLNYTTLLAFIPIKSIAFYGEIFGQTKTSPYTGSGLGSDFGILLGPTKNVAIDLEFGNRISGKFGFSRYVGGGLTLLFD